MDLPPYAPTLIESTRAIGYSLEAAVADIIDNAAELSVASMSVMPVVDDAVMTSLKASFIPAKRGYSEEIWRIMRTIFGNETETVFPSLL